jgi:hypothetical protein
LAAAVDDGALNLPLQQHGEQAESHRQDHDRQDDDDRTALSG